MSNIYRDDTHEIAEISSKVMMLVKGVSMAAAIISSSVLTGVLASYEVNASISDSITDKTVILIEDTATISDFSQDQLTAINVLSNRLSIKDGAKDFILHLNEDTATISDSVIDSRETTMSVLVSESLAISDEALPQRYVSSLVSEQKKIKDSLLLISQELVVEQVTLAETLTEKLTSRSIVEEQLAISDEFTDGNDISSLVVDSASIESSVTDGLTAKDVVQEVALEISDEVIYIGQPEDKPTNSGTGQAWTANTENWAMSRYAPYTFKGLAVIDGVLYGYADSGIYRLDGNNEDDIEAVLQTDKLDLSAGILSHPTQAVMEYNLDGEASMEVGVTQSGQYASYEYDIQKEFADELTNGRFIFGRGLRGRHFSFAIKLKGKSAHINDIVVSSTETKRRI